MKEARYLLKVICTERKFYVFGVADKDFKLTNSIIEISFQTNSWKWSTNMYNDRQLYSVCSFLDSVYLIGGNLKEENTIFTNSCVQFNTSTTTWKDCTFVGMDTIRLFKKESSVRWRQRGENQSSCTIMRLMFVKNATNGLQ